MRITGIRKRSAHEEWPEVRTDRQHWKGRLDIRHIHEVTAAKEGRNVFICSESVAQRLKIRCGIQTSPRMITCGPILTRLQRLLHRTHGKHEEIVEAFFNVSKELSRPLPQAQRLASLHTGLEGS